MKRILSILSLIAIGAGVYQFASAQDDEHPMGFFLTSKNIGNGADLGGLAGAVAHCQMLAEGNLALRLAIGQAYDEADLALAQFAKSVAK